MKMMQMRGFALCAISALVLTALADTSPEIKNVKAKQRYPWNGKVDITYEVVGDLLAGMSELYMPTFTISASNRVDGTEYVADYSALSGDIDAAEGSHHVVWDLNAQKVTIKSEDVVFAVAYVLRPKPYCIIDLSAGANATSYPVSYLSDVPSGGFNVDEYKTTKLVLKRLDAGSFKMLGSYDVTLTKPLFCGLFEVTQKQYSLVTGSNPSHFSGDKRPVENVSYNAIRGDSEGAKWPSSSAVDSTSFMGKLRARTGLDFDLPTEAQWEYACRAGTTTTYNYGSSADGSYMWYDDNSGSQTHEVGTRLPNTWGIYDMHGNVLERCLDYCSQSQRSLTGGVDPRGPESGDVRVSRGGSWFDDAAHCGISYWYWTTLSHKTNRYGFRLVRTLSDKEVADEEVGYRGESPATTIDLTAGIRTTTHAERIRYSTDWSGGASSGARVDISVNDELFVSVTGTGYVDWIPTHNGTYTLTHKVMSGGEQLGETLTAVFFFNGFTDAPVISPANDTIFINAVQEVTISCDTSGATILYTMDGSDPVLNGIEYRRPFQVYKSCTLRAIARKLPLYDSNEVVVTLTRAEGLSEAANLYGYTMETDSAAPWTVDAAVSHDGVSSVRSGAIGNNGMTYLMASVRKAGTVSFWWKAQCEEPDEEYGEDGYYDYGVFLVDDVVKARIAGNDTGWRFVSVEVPTGGKHVLRWEYRKDGATSYAPDFVWVDQVQWIPADGSGYTLTSPEPVPYSWLSQYGLGVASGDFEAAANAASGKLNCGRPTEVWEEYVAGLDPTNANSQLKAMIEMRGETPLVTWEPNLNDDGVARRLYKVYGSETLENGGEWQYPTNALHRFFKVTVEMP